MGADNRGQMEGPLWEAMSKRPRFSMSSLTAAGLPEEPGVYAFYRQHVPVYVGLAEKQSLRGRVWGNHRGRGVSMTGSALRRNVAEHLGIASAADIKSGRYQPSPADAATVVEWIDECRLAWIECASPSEAKALESEMKAEWMPPLTKR
jgi:hypothetical protein